MSNIYNWDTIAANNANADSSINWAEGMPPSDVNDSARVMMGRVKEFVIDIGGSIVATGTANVIAVTTQSAFTTLANGRMLSFRAIATNSQATTINVNSIGAKPILKATGSGIVALTGREIQAAAMYTLQYSTALNSGNGAWLLLNPSATGTPAGIVSDFASATIPDGWLLCYGQAVSRTTYADLFSAIGTLYGSGDGSTTFNVPDYRGYVLAGLDNMGGTTAARLTEQGASTTLGSVGGAQTVTLTEAQMPSHQHGGSTTAAGGHNHTVQSQASGGGGAGLQNASNGVLASIPTSSVPDHIHGVVTDFRGGNQAHLNIQPTAMTNKIIKF